MSRPTIAHQVIRASAGSGKTFQLTNRYLALLVNGADPATMLATTFTRKAAGEILDRVLQRLAEAARGAAKAQALAVELGLPRGTKLEAAAQLRRLVDRLHGLRIGTLDSFLMALAGSFGLELGLPAGWTIGEELDDRALRREALERLLADQPEDIVRLFPLLSKGESRRSVHEELDRVINEHYDIFRDSDAAAWTAVQAPPPVAEAVRTAALARLAEFDMSTCGHKGFAEARDRALADIRREDWPAFVGNGLAKKVRAGETTYQRKPIPQEVQDCYRTLLEHARAEILRRLAEQTQATHDLLQRFHGGLWTLKQASGQLRFQEVTRALVDGLEQKLLRADGLAFRLNGPIEHLLLDEFQDTARAQWQVLAPIAEGITAEAPAQGRSFFCVGDVKQAIYGWRGGMAEIFNALESSLGPLQQMPLDESRRSAPVVIDVVNRVFGYLGRFEAGDKAQAGIDAWRERFTPHTTHQTELAGHVRLMPGPEKPEEQDQAAYRRAFCKYVAGEIGSIHKQAPGRSIGVLCRKKKAVGRMIYELRQLGVEASEEAGSTLDDSPAVEAILSLFTLADHPGHSIAWFHLKNTPFREEFQEFDHPDRVARLLRSELMEIGYGALVQRWAEALAPACDRRDLSRLQQLVEMAYAFQERSTLRADGFVHWVRAQRMPDPQPAPVRVMTIHGAKGLEFDVVVLPELDDTLLGQTPAFVAGRDEVSLAVNVVCRYVKDAVQEMLDPAVQRAFAQHRQREAEESLSLLYVALTRAIHALHMFIPGPGTSNRKDAWFTLLHQALAEGSTKVACAPLFEAGTSAWTKAPPSPRLGERQGPAPEPPPQIAFRSEPAPRRRGLRFEAPSRKEGGARLPLKHVFKESEGTGMAAGTLYHAWFETIEWLDDGAPAEAVLRAAAARKRWDLPADTWRDLDTLLTQFLKWLGDPVIAGVLCRTAYADPKSPSFPRRLASSATLTPHHVERERRFLVPEGERLWNGSLDRIVWLGNGQRVVAADVIDFKTDAIEPGNTKAVAERMEHYRPQIEAYRHAVACMAQLPLDCIAARLVFPFAGRVVEV
jgi:ATP-dependent exoDNAse (exonuclease V) beta subunit